MLLAVYVKFFPIIENASANVSKGFALSIVLLVASILYTLYPTESACMHCAGFVGTSIGVMAGSGFEFSKTSVFQAFVAMATTFGVYYLVAPWLFLPHWATAFMVSLWISFGAKALFFGLNKCPTRHSTL